jgi:hypothetical protein
MLHALLTSSIAADHIPIETHQHFSKVVSHILAEASLAATLREFFEAVRSDGAFDKMKQRSQLQMGLQLNELLREWLQSSRAGLCRHTSTQGGSVSMLLRTTEAF